MKLWDIVKNVGGAIVKDVVPGGGLIMSAVNALMPADKQLAEDATGDQMNEAIQSLPPDQRAQILDKEFDVKLEQIKQSHNTLRTMLTADATSAHTTRPKMAWGCFQIVGAIALIVISLWAYAVAIENYEMVETIMAGWPFVVGIISPFVYCMHAYFGILKTEQKNKLDAAGGHAPQSGLVNLIKMFKK